MPPSSKGPCHPFIITGVGFLTSAWAMGVALLTGSAFTLSEDRWLLKRLCAENSHATYSRIPPRAGLSRPDPGTEEERRELRVERHSSWQVHTS